MGGIRKKTSKRGTSHNRAKISKKVAETHKKRKRDGKKDPTWKSKKKADPGIPNSFPFKDQVLAELAEEKRKTEEAKQLRKQAARAQANGEDQEDDTPGIASLSSSSVITRPATSSATLGVPEEEEEDDVPVLVDTQLGTLQEVLDRADVILQVVDARDILGGRSEFLEGLVRDSGGRYGVIVNKIDLIPRETLQAWLPHLPPNTFLYSTTSTTPLGRSQLLQTLSSWSSTTLPPIPSTSTPQPNLTIALIGLPSTGKTSILNSLLPASTPKKPVAPPIPAVASAKNPEPTTKAPVEVEVNLPGGGSVRVIDTPGWEFVEDDEEGEVMAGEEGEKIWDELEERVAGDLLRRNLGRVDRVKDVMPLVNYIFRRSNPQDLMLVYNLPTFPAGDITAFLTSLARANGRVRKHGEPDLDSAARIILRDWAHNTFPYYTTPPKSTAGDGGMEVDRLDMGGVLEECKSRKEMRGAGRGLVRFKSGEIDHREVILDDDYNALAGAESDEDEDEEDEDEDLEIGEELEDDEEELHHGEEDDEGDEDEDEDEDDLPLIDGDEEVLDLEDGPEPSSGSDIPDDEDDDDEEEEEQEEEEEEEPIPVSALKRKRPAESPKTKAKKAKRVSFGKDVRGSGAVGGGKRGGGGGGRGGKRGRR